MGQSEVDAATYWLSWIELGSTVALFCVALGVGYEFIADRAAAPLRRRIEDARRDELTWLGAQAAAANARAAEAAAKAEQLRQENLALQRRIQPREVAPDQVDAFVAALKATAGQRFEIAASAADAEGSVFAGRLYRLLLAAGWTPGSSGIRYGAFLDLVVGVQIKPDPSAAAMEAGDVLRQALAGADVATSLAPESGPKTRMRPTTLCGLRSA